MLDQHMLNHMFGEYEILAHVKTRQHTVECQGVVVSFHIQSEHMLRLCQMYPALEEEMWRRAAVTASKLLLTTPPHDYRHRFTRDLRIAFQNGRVSSPIMRKLRRQLLDDNESEVIVLPTKDDHVFFLRTKYPGSQSHHYYPGQSQHKVNGDMVTKGRDHILASGPGTITIHSDEVAIIYKLDVTKLRNGFGTTNDITSTSSTKPLRSKSLPSKVSKVSNIVQREGKNNKEDEGDGDEKKIDSSKEEEKKESKIEIEMSKI